MQERTVSSTMVLWKPNIHMQNMMQKWTQNAIIYHNQLKMDKDQDQLQDKVSSTNG